MAGKPQTENTDELKAQYIEYYRELPVQRYAAAFIARSEDTIIRWRLADAKFADNVDRAKAEWVKKKAGKTPPAWVLERLEREVFAPPKQEIEVTNPINEVLKGFGIEPITTTTNETPTTSGTPLT